MMRRTLLSIWTGARMTTLGRRAVPAAPEAGPPSSLSTSAAEAGQFQSSYKVSEKDVRFIEHCDSRTSPAGQPEDHIRPGRRGTHQDTKEEGRRPASDAADPGTRLASV